MSGDWIKMRGNLWDDPRVAAIVDATDTSEAAVVGGLYWLWATADQHTEDGMLPGLSVRQIDRKTGVSGLGDALIQIGWIVAESDGIRIANFKDHNGASAKKRCQTAKRVAKFKSGNAQETPEFKSGNAPSVSAALPRDRDREEIDQKQDQKKEQASPSGSRLPPDWQLPDDWRQWAEAERPGILIRDEAAKFADYWHGVAGAKGRKADWAGTWRNWIRNSRAIGNQRAGPVQAAPGKTMQALQALEDLKNGLVNPRNPNRIPEADLPRLGSSASR